MTRALPVLILLMVLPVLGKPTSIPLLVPRGQAHAQASPKPTPEPTPLAAEPSPSPSPTPEGPVLAVRDCLARAIQGNPDILAARARIEQARWAVENAYVPLSPTVQTYISYTRTFQPVPGASGLTTVLNTLIPGLISSSAASPNSYSGAMIYQQTLTTFGRVKWTVLYKKLSEKQSKQDYRTSLETLMQTTEKAFVQARLNLALVNLAGARLGYRREYLRLSTNLFKAGQVAEFDVIQSQSQVESAVQGLQDTITQQETARVALLILMGADPLEKVNLSDLDPLDPPPPSVQEGLARAYERRPELCSGRWSLASAEAQALSAAHSNAPSLLLYSSYSSTYVPITPISQSWSAGLQLTVPIYDGGQAYTSTRQAIAVAEQMHQQLDSTVRQVKKDVATAYVQLVSQWKQVQSARLAAQENDETLAIAFNRYKAGVSSGTELLTAQENWNQAQTSYLQAEANYRFSYVDWRKAISGEYPVPIPADYMVDWEAPPLVLPPSDQSPDERLADPATTTPSRINQ